MTTIVTALAAAYKGRNDLQRPRDREAAAIRDCIAAESTLIAAAGARQRPALRFALRRAGNLTRTMELTKAS